MKISIIVSETITVFRRMLRVYYFILAISREVLCLGHIFEVENLMDLYVLRSLESENHIFRVWSECMCVRLCVFVSTCR